ncbi:MAG: hypothetical protein QOK03_962, partial [Candidatus Binataceae bacterium]|nr:hypothetical protein [Candidatus Binataceae bacterium]
MLSLQLFKRDLRALERAVSSIPAMDKPCEGRKSPISTSAELRLSDLGTRRRCNYTMRGERNQHAFGFGLESLHDRGSRLKGTVRRAGFELTTDFAQFARAKLSASTLESMGSLTYPLRIAS